MRSSQTRRAYAVGDAWRARLLRGMCVALVMSCGVPVTAPPVNPLPVPVVDVCAVEVQPGPTAFRRLTRFEYNQTVLDLLGDDTHSADAFPPDEDGLGYPVGATVSPLLAEHYLDAAERIASRLTEARLEALAPCEDERLSRCAERFIVQFGRRAYRRHLDTAQVARLMDVFALGQAEGGFHRGVRLVISAMLQSPYFLYLIELGAESGPVGEALPLSMDERASRLSYFLWGSMPDPPLFDAADRGQLRSRTQIEVQARRMLADPRARQTVTRFVDQWLELELDDVHKDAETYPSWSSALAESMSASTHHFVEHVVFESSGTLRELLTAPYMFVDESLAAWAGANRDAEEGFVRVPVTRAGILMQPTFLAHHARSNESSPVRRGHAIRNRLLCQQVPDPPDALMVSPPDPDPNLSTRARYEEHGSNPACMACHVLMEPLAFPLERFDGVGRFRTEENGFLIDASGEISGTRASNRLVRDEHDLVQALAASPEVMQCFARQFWRFAFRRLEAPVDECSLGEVDEAFEASGGDVRTLLVSIVLTDAFLYRSASNVRVAP